MRSWDFLTDEETLDDWFRSVRTVSLNEPLLEALIAGPLPDRSDIEVAVALARFTHEQFEGHGTHQNQEVTQSGSILVMRALMAVLRRLGITSFDPPYRDFDTFSRHWRTSGATGAGGWQARRDLLDEDFQPLHRLLDEREAGSIASTLAVAVSPHRVVGWPRVDEELSEMRRHFEAASTRQDYSNVGNDAVSVLEALSAVVYDHAAHGVTGEPEPPVASTKKRLDRYIEVALPGSDNTELRKVARSSIELAQAVKHRRGTATRREAGIAADSVILLANLLRRLQD